MQTSRDLRKAKEAQNMIQGQNRLNCEDKNATWFRHKQKINL